MSTRSRALLGGLLSVATLTGASALAAEPAEDAADAQEAQRNSPATTLDAITVTAQKRAEREQDVPISLTAISAEQMVSENQLRLQDYLGSVPGTSVNDLGFGRTQVVIRGISTGIGNNPTTGFTIDDVPVGSSTSTGAADLFVPNLDPSDLQAVEVLRGPQGTLYGASSMGGLVKYITADPHTDGVESQVGVDVSSVAHGGVGFGVRASANLPVNDRFALRASGFYRKTPGFIDDAVQGRKDLNSGESRGARLAAFWQIAPSVSLKLSALMQDQDAGGGNTQDVKMDGSPIYADLSRARLVGTDSFISKTRLYTANLAADLGWADLASITGYSSVQGSYPQDVSGNFQPFTPMFYGQSLPVKIDTTVATDKLTQEFRLTSQGEGRLQWMMGTFFTREEGEQSAVIAPADATTGAPLALPVLMTNVGGSVYRELAAFGSLAYSFTDQFDVTVGGRHSKNKLDTESLVDGLLYGGMIFGGTSMEGGATTFMVSPRYKFSDSMMAYARVASGYRPGGYNSAYSANAVAGLAQTYDEDSTVNYEIGLKGDAWDRRMTYSASVFYIDWSDIQIRQTDPATALSFYGNAGQAKSQGAEVAIQAMPAVDLTVDFNLSYTDAHLTDDAPSGTYAPAGSRLPNSSKWSSSFSVRRDFDLSDSVRGYASLKVAYTGDRVGPFTIAATAARFNLPAYTTIDAQFGAEFGNWTAGLFLRNIGDKRGFLAAQPLNSVAGVGGAHYVSVIQPRTIGLSLTGKF